MQGWVPRAAGEHMCVGPTWHGQWGSLVLGWWGSFQPLGAQAGGGGAHGTEKGPCARGALLSGGRAHGAWFLRRAGCVCTCMHLVICHVCVSMSVHRRARLYDLHVYTRLYKLEHLDMCV